MATPVITTSQIDLNTNLGLTQVSSVSVSAPTVSLDPFTGQATITTQRMDIEYYRQPLFGAPNYNVSTVTLSGIIIPTEPQFGSIMRIKVTAHSEQTITSATWQGSSIFIPQTFDAQISDLDIHGNSYGISGTSGIAGPAGRFITRTMGVYRRPTQLGDTTWSESIINLLDFGEVSSTWGYTESNQYWWGNWDLANLNAYGTPQSLGLLYWINGKYNPTLEDPKQVVMLLDQIAREMKSNGLFDNKNPSQRHTVSHYDVNFHSYT